MKRLLLVTILLMTLGLLLAQVPERSSTELETSHSRIERPQGEGVVRLIENRRISSEQANAQRSSNRDVTYLIEDDFTTGDDWTAIGTGPNQWYHGSVVGNPAPSMFISNDEGVSNNWTAGYDGMSVAHFYREITFPENAINMILSFDSIGKGDYFMESFFAWMEVGLTDTVPLAGELLEDEECLDYWADLYSWTNINVSVPGSYAGTTQYLVFSFRSLSGSYYGTPAPAFDNIKLSYVDAPPQPLPAILVSPANGATFVPTDSALNWIADEGAVPTGYKVHFGETNPPVFVANTTETTWTPAVMQGRLNISGKLFLLMQRAMLIIVLSGLLPLYPKG